MIRLNIKGCEFDCKDGGFIPESRNAQCCNFLSEMIYYWKRDGEPHDK